MERDCIIYDFEIVNKVGLVILVSSTDATNVIIREIIYEIQHHEML